MLLLNMCNILKLSGFLVCLGGGPCKVFQCQLGQKKLLGFGLLGGISTQSDAMFLLNQAF